MIAILMAGLVGLGLALVAAPASAALMGKYIDAELRADTIAADVLTPFTSPAMIVDPGVEFSGVLQFGRVCPGSCKGGIELDFDDTGFTVRGYSVDGFSNHNASFGLFEVRIFNLPSNIIGITEFSGLGPEARLDIEGGAFPNVVVSLSYGGWAERMSDRYEFQFRPVPVPEPASLPIFLTALARLGFMGWRRRTA
jgi:hypothetical protein